MPYDAYRPYRLSLGLCSTLTMLMALTAQGVAAPLSIPVCTDYGCDRRQQVTLGPEHWHGLVNLFHHVRDAQDERDAIRAAIARMEHLAGTSTDTWRDLARNRAGAGQAGQLDCIAESRNTETYLRLLEKNSLLKWHRVEGRERRQRWIFSFHWTAVISELPSGTHYAVDSWFRDNGERPHIQTMTDWRAGRDFSD